ncbi:MAG: hypothetical protein KAI66_28110, partial [Lentisphaeria bacterium]|nr:hypothetical protein [Lentisphaeria bacterium]
MTTVSGASSIAVFVRDAEAIIGDVLDVTDDVTTDWPADGWTMDPRTGTMFGTFSLTNNTDSSKTLKEVFRYAVPDTDQIRLMHPDGTLDDGTPYVDITALVEAALPTVGNGDLNLDPGETVTITGIEFYSFDRTAPAGYVFAVWADPPMEEPTVATRADLNWHATFSSGTQRGALELVIGAATGATEGLDAFFDVPTDEFAELWSVPADLDTPAMQQDIRPLAGTGSWMIGALGDAGPLDLSWTRSDLPMGLMLTLTRLDEDGQPLQATRVEVTSDGVIEVDGDAGLGIDLGTEASVELHLALGWNMVSFPMIPVPGTVETLLAALPEQAEVQQYENG